MKRNPEQGLTLVETLVALVILAIGIMAVARVFPSVSANQLSARMLTAGSNFAREQQEQLGALPWTDAALTDGRHPAGTATDDIGSNNAWHRYYNVTTLTGTLSDLKRVVVTVRWTFNGTDSTMTTTYFRR
ncbi:MAG: prepilin-type N-terminal cleavage/methylation domain-containing protein [Candidatus Eisenbacteria bacterium]|uniref:Prepilin-type N-terminal cleavage/methylation domain-containing protein n=1 Tax=Eiseniibacteriota bacterium TaxID=2212470 RepID=A0A538SAI1_UNCEI|nr:MAG: prepilin-type N-terminal cleavage/methylation domain-containing protein [Candidatus Eisenbacteria bacterium]